MTFAVCMSGIDEYENIELMESMRVEAEKKDARLLFFEVLSYSYGEKGSSNWRTWHNGVEIFSYIPYDKIDGLIMCAESIKDEEVISGLVTNAKAVGIPVISFDRKEDGCANVTMDYSGALRTIIRHVIEHHGKRNINFLTGMHDEPNSEERLAIYREEMIRHGLPYDEERVAYGDYWRIPAKKAVENFLESGKEIDAIICANDEMAFATFEVLEEHGIKCPEDIIVTGIDGVDSIYSHKPLLTTAKRNYKETGKLLIDKIINMTDGCDNDDSLVPLDILINGSCGCHETERVISNKDIQDVLEREAFNRGFFEFLNDMSSALIGVDDLETMCEKLDKYIGNLNDPMIMLSMKKGFFSEQFMKNGDSSLFMDTVPDEDKLELLAANIRTYKIPYREYEGDKEKFLESDNPRIMGVANPDEVKVETHNVMEYDRSEVIPDLDDALEKYGSIVISPITGAEGLTAFLAYAPKIPYRNFNRFYLFTSNMGTILDTVRLRIIQNSLIERLQNMTGEDFLTGLCNRSGFMEQISPLIASSRENKVELSVFSLDLNGLKYINDNYGHNEGDSAIKTAADAIISVCDTDIVGARFGGDEFVIAAYNIGNDRAKEIADNIKKNLEVYNSMSEKPYNVSVSIGIKTGIIKEGNSFDNMMLDADRKMYDDKLEFYKNADDDMKKFRNTDRRIL